MASSSESEANKSDHSSGAGSTSSSKSLTFYHKSTTEIDYCIRTINLIISNLKLSIPPLKTLEQLTMENLVRIHCALLGIRFSEEFIPSSNPKEDAERMILSLKDRFGSDKFGSLDAEKIAQKNPTQIRFLLENFHLILNYQLAQEKKSKESELVKSDSGNHLSVWRPSFDVTGADSFYLPPANVREGASGMGKTTFEDSTDDSFQTVENIVINVYDDSTSASDEPTSDPLFKNGVNPSATENKQQMKPSPLTSSPIATVHKVPCHHHISNISSIRHSRSALGNLHKTPDTSKSKYCKSKLRSQSLSLQRNKSCVNKGFKLQSHQTAVEVLARNPHFGQQPFSTNTQNTIRRKPRSGKNETQFMSETESSQSDADGELKKVRDMHSKIRSQISESLIDLEKDISRLKRKPSKTEANTNKEPLCRPKPLPNLRWMLPVDARYPNYNRGVIIPKCTSWRSRSRQPKRPAKKISEVCVEVEDSGAFSTDAQKGSQYYGNQDEEEELLYDE